MAMRPTTLLVGLAASLAVACGAAVSETEAPARTAADEIAETLADDNAPLLVKDPRTLVALEEQGLALASQLGVAGSNGADLATSPAYDRIVSTIAFDLKRLRQADPKSGVGVDFPHRQLDAEWLRSPQSRFELVAVVNRLDRMHAGGCGETRLVYRLAYRATRSESRLPVTFNVIHPQTGICAEVAQRWLAAESGSPGALLKGPLAELPPWERIEIDYQAVRWPSNERRDMGGHAEYVLRVFRRTAEGVEPAPLENTPRANLTAAEKEELRGWIREHVTDIDQGTALVPEKFLAMQAISVAPHGLARAANRAFGQLFPDAAAAFGDVAMPERLASPAGLLRRLDTMTCHGCHQSRSIAGFHLLGEERDNEARLNALAIGRSPHMLEELPWRTAFVRAVARGEEPGPRPFAEHASTDGKNGAHCGLGDPAFASWTCAEGLACLALHGGPVGVCSPVDAPVGDSCETVTLSSNPDPHRDRLTSHAVTACNDSGRDARCNPASQGFPDGLCRTDCTDAEVGTIEGSTICGLVPSASGLTQCLAAHRPFKECLASQNTPTFLRTCDRTEPCRDDYACARVKDGPPGIGACMPPYFAFQARVDGHLFD